MQAIWEKYSALIWPVAGALLVVVLLLMILHYGRALWRNRPRGLGGGRGGAPRLGLVETVDVEIGREQRRQLALVRRDNVVHLVMIGGPNDLLLEADVRLAGVAPVGGDRRPRAAAPQPDDALQPNAPTVQPQPAPPTPVMPVAPPPIEPPSEAATNPPPAPRDPPRPVPAVPPPPFRPRQPVEPPARVTPPLPARTQTSSRAQGLPAATQTESRPQSKEPDLNQLAADMAEAAPAPVVEAPAAVPERKPRFEPSRLAPRATPTWPSRATPARSEANAPPAIDAPARQDTAAEASKREDTGAEERKVEAPVARPPVPKVEEAASKPAASVASETAAPRIESAATQSEATTAPEVLPPAPAVDQRTDSEKALAELEAEMAKLLGRPG